MLILKGSLVLEECSGGMTGTWKILGGFGTGSRKETHRTVSQNMTVAWTIPKSSHHQDTLIYDSGKGGINLANSRGAGKRIVAGGLGHHRRGTPSFPPRPQSVHIRGFGPRRPQGTRKRLLSSEASADALNLGTGHVHLSFVRRWDERSSPFQ